MAPTLTWIDSFQHQQSAATFYGTNAGVYDSSVNGSAITFVAGQRAGTFAAQLAEDGVNQTRIGKNWAASVRTVIESFYFKISAIPSVDSIMWHGVDANGNFQIQVLASSGFLKWIAVNGAANAKTLSTNVCDGNWHRIDLYCNSTANPGTMDLSFDGVAQAQATGAQNAADITASRFGSTATGHTLTFAVQDWVCSQTIADHPIGAHVVDALVPNADGTHSWGSTNMGPASGGVASSVTTLYQEVDDWATVTADTTTYIQYANTTATSTEYAEITLPDITSGTTVWGARAVAAILSATTTANSATTRVVDGSGSTVLDLYVGDQSDTTNRHQATMVPSITTATALNALKWRVGFPTDSNPAPQWSALMIDWAGPAEPAASSTAEFFPVVVGA